MDTIVIGAGIAGLRCAAALRDDGRSVCVLEKSRGVGGRCATRRIDGQPVDHGVPFLHGDDEGFRAAVEEAAADGLVPGWPDRVVGAGRPCDRRALRPDHWRCAIRPGVNTFAKRLAVDLEVRTGVHVVAVRAEADRFVVRDADGGEHVARDLVIALPAPQAAALLTTIEDPDPGTRTAVELLETAAMESCITVLAGYDADRPEPEFDLWLPDDGDVVQTIVHDSSKRDRPAWTVLVVQAFAAWSSANLSEPVEVSGRALLEEVGRIAGRRFAMPRAFQVHRWRYARPYGGSQLAAPMLLRPRETGMMALTGDLFAPGGGVQGAWRAGGEIARRMRLEER